MLSHKNLREASKNSFLVVRELEWRIKHLPYRLHKCLGVRDSGTDSEEKCEKFITWQFAICSDCEQEFGNRAIYWPPWLRDAWNAEQRRRRRVYRQSNNEILFTDLEVALGLEDE